MARETKSKKSVLLLTSSFPRWNGDSHAHMVLGLGQALARSGTEVKVLAPHFPGAKFSERIGEVEVRRFPYFFPFSAQTICGDEGIIFKIKARPWLAPLFPLLVISEFFHLALFLARNRTDTVFAQWLIPQGLVACLLKPFFRFRLVSYAIEGDNLLLHPSVLSFIRKTVLKYSDAVVAVSPLVEGELRAAFPDLAGKITVIPFGIDTKTFRPGSRSREKSILFIGRLVGWKGAQNLIACMPEILAAEPDAKVVIVGSGPMEQKLRSIATEKDVEGSVEFLGQVPHNRLHRVIQESAVFVHPANENGGKETLGIALLEAMACGSAIVGARTGAIPYVLEDGKAGVLVEPEQQHELAEAVIRILSDPRLRKELGRRARAEQFSWDRIACRFEEILIPAGE